MKLQVFLGFLLVLALAATPTEASDSADRDAVLAVLKEWGISDDVITKHEGLSPSAKFHKPKNLAELIELGKSMGAKPKDLAKAPEIARKFGIPDN